MLPITLRCVLEMTDEISVLGSRSVVHSTVSDRLCDLEQSSGWWVIFAFVNYVNRQQTGTTLKTSHGEIIGS